jgi:uncharacterized protein DUF6920
MVRWVRVAALVASGLGLTTAVVLVAAAARWRRASARVVGLLGAGPAEPGRYARVELEGLPAPVARYFDFALTPGRPLVRRARVTQAGTFARSRDVWSPFTAVEEFAVWPPGFVWDASVRMVPLLPVRVRDSYIGGEGAMQGTFAGVVSIVHQRGTPEVAAGALLRYLAEGVWLPTALLPSAGVRWEALDDSTARATLTDATTTVSMDVHFGPEGEVAGISAQRYRDVDGEAVLTPWAGSFRAYTRVDGMMVPLESEVGWVLPDGWFPYFRARNVKLEYAFRVTP